MVSPSHPLPAPFVFSENTIDKRRVGRLISNNPKYQQCSVTERSRGAAAVERGGARAGGLQFAFMAPAVPRTHPPPQRIPPVSAPRKYIGGLVIIEDEVRGMLNELDGFSFGVC